MSARDYAAAVATGSLVFGTAGTTPHLLFTFRGVRPFWSQFETDLLGVVVSFLPRAALHSIAAAVVCLFVLWMIIGSVITALVWSTPFVRRRSLRQQVLIAAITPCVVLPLLAMAAPFEPPF